LLQNCFGVLRHQQSDPAEKDLVVFWWAIVQKHLDGVRSGAKMKVGQSYQRGGGSWLVT